MKYHITLTIILVLINHHVISENDASFTTKVKGISADLESELDQILKDDNVKFTAIPMSAKYNSSTKFEQRGTNELYMLSRYVVDFLWPKEAIPKGLIRIEGDKIAVHEDDLRREWLTITKHYGVMVLVYVIGAIFIVVMPFCGLIYCCCRCIRCHERVKPYDDKYDPCRRFCYAMIMIILTTGLLLGACSTLITNYYMQAETDNVPTTARVAVNDVQRYISFTQNQLSVLFSTNFKELKKELEEILDESGVIVSNKLKEYSNAVALSQLASIVNVLPDISNDLRKMKDVSNKLRTNASQLNDGLRHVKRELLQELNECQNLGVRECKDFGEVNKLDTSVDFDQLPDVSDLLKNLTEIVESDIIREVEQGKKAFDNIQKEIQRAVDDSIPVVKDSIRRAGDAIERNYKNASQMLGSASDELDRRSRSLIREADYFLNNDRYSVVRWYYGFAIGGCLLAIALFFSCGLLCGICGRRPDGYGDECCDKGTGDCSLGFATALSFLTASLFMLIFLMMMTSGLMVQRGVCDPLRQPESENSREIWSVVNHLVEYDLNGLISNCHRNLSIYRVAHLDRQFDVRELETYLQKYEISKKISILKDKIKMSNGIVILTPIAKQKLQKLSESGLGDISYDRFMDVLRDNITSLNIFELSQKLNDTAIKIGDRPHLQKIKLAMQRNALYLNAYYVTFVVPMYNSAMDLKDTASRLEVSLKFNHSSFQEAVHDLLREVEEAQDYLQRNGTKVVGQIAESFAVSLEKRVQRYLNYVSDQIQNRIGQCGPLSNAYNATVVAVCDKIVQPYNGFWLGLGWCLLLYVPLIIYAIKLCKLYQKKGPYPGPSYDGDYSVYDAYYSDHVPMKPRKCRKKSKKHGRGPLYHQEQPYDHADYVLETGPSDPTVDAPVAGGARDARYNDMAPKHWEDFPNGGPPNYQSAPIAPEYERPPPYYYPGPGK